MICTVVYRSLKHVKDFIKDFSDLLGSLVLRHDQLLIVWDFNIHVRCESGPPVKDFLALIDSVLLSGSRTLFW